MKGNAAEVKKMNLLSLLFWGIAEYVIHCRIIKCGALIKVMEEILSMVFAFSSCSHGFFIALANLRTSGKSQ